MPVVVDIVEAVDVVDVVVFVVAVDISEFVGAIDVVVRLTLSILNEELALNSYFNMVVQKLRLFSDFKIRAPL